MLTFNKKCSDFDDLTRNLKEIHFPVRSTANGPVNFHGKKCSHSRIETWLLSKSKVASYFTQTILKQIFL